MNFHSEKTPHISKIELLVADIKAMEEFYTKVLAFSILEKGEDYVSLTANKKEELIRLTHKPDTILKNTITQGLYHFALLFPTRVSLAKLYYNILIKQKKLSGMSDHGVSEALYLNDPEGNGIELYVDRPVQDWPYLETGELNMYTDTLNWQNLLATVTQPGFDGIDSGVVMGHLHLQTKEFAPAKKLFVEVLGFHEIQNLFDTALFVSKDNYHHHLAFNLWAYDKPIRQANQTGMLSYTISLSKADFDNIKQNLKANKMELFSLENKFYIYDMNGDIIYFELH